MKKKLLFVIMVCAVLALAVVLVGCGNTKLANPRNLNLSEGYLMWGEVKGADGYLVYFNDDLVNRYYVENTYLAIDDPEIRSSLRSGSVNNMYVRAVNLDKNKLPVNASDRSLIKFNYSRQLATPNKVTLKGEKFSWRAVSEAKDYQAYVRQDGQTEGTLYKMTWQTGTASVSGTINDLPNGLMYYVSIVACCDGYENSVPSVEVPFDRTVVNVDKSQYFVFADGQSVRLTESDEDDVYSAELTLKADSSVSVKDNAGAEFELTKPTLVNGDYEVKLNTATKKATLTKITNYYLFAGASAQGEKLLLGEGGYITAATFTDGMTYVVKDDEGNSLTTYSDDSASQGTAFAGGSFLILVNAETKEVTVKATESSGNDTPETSKDGKWAVTLHYNFPNSPADIVVYVENNRSMATPAKPVRNGFVFAGWYEDPTCVIEAEFGSKSSYFKITAPTDLYAKWTVDTTLDPDPQPGPGPDPQPGPGPNPLPDCDYHVDANGDGKCDKCTRDMPVVEDTYGTIYLNVSNFSWFADNNANINVHIWYDDGTNNNWPGAKMTLKNGLYEAQYYTSRTVKGIIFTRNDPNPNPNEGSATEWDRIEIGENLAGFDANHPVYYLRSYRHADEVCEFSGKWLAVGEEDPIYVTGDKKAYLDFRNVDWFASAGAKLYAYVWYTDESKNAEFPGKEMLFTNGASETHYCAYIEYSSEKTLAGIIFTRNDPRKPITGEGEGLWNKIEISAAAGNLGLTAALPAFRLTSVNGNDFEGTWVSEEAALSGTGVIVTPDPDPTPDPAWNGTVTVDLSRVAWFGDEGCVPYIYVWYSDKTDNAKYPGVKMTAAQKAGNYTYVIDTTKQEVSGLLIVRVSADGKTMYNKTRNYALPATHIVTVSEGDLEIIPEDQRTIETGSPDPGPVQTITVYYYNKNNWSTVKAYAWSGDGESAVKYLGDWPGTAMTAVAGKAGWYQIAVNKNATKIAFTNGLDGDANKTADLALIAATPYYKDGWTADYPAEAPAWDGTVTIDVTALPWFENDSATAYLYVWYTDDTNNGTYPGVKMTWVINGIYHAKIDTTKTFAGLKLTRRSADGTVEHNATGDITVMPENHTIVITSMN